MDILCIDPSLNCTGYVVLHYEDEEITILESGITYNKNIPSKLIGQKLFNIESALSRLFCDYQFQAIVKEASFSNQRIKATQRIFEVLGVINCICYKNGYTDIAELAPTTVKKLVGGNGKCSKDEVKDNLYYYVGWYNYKTEDISDAVAVGIAYLKQKQFNIKLKSVMAE